jgi:hypothetical protein
MTAHADRLKRNNRIAGGICLLLISGVLALLLVDIPPARTFADSLRISLIVIIALGFATMGALLLALPTKTKTAPKKSKRIDLRKASFSQRNRLPFIIALSPLALIALSFLIEVLSNSAYQAGLLERGSPLLSVVYVLQPLATLAGIAGFGTAIPAVIAAVIVARTQPR